VPALPSLARSAQYLPLVAARTGSVHSAICPCAPCLELMRMPVCLRARVTRLVK
jgi:hypothetical protein